MNSGWNLSYGVIRNGCQYTNTLRFWEKKLAEPYHSGTHSSDVIKYLCLVGVVRELRGAFEVSLEV